MDRILLCSYLVFIATEPESVVLYVLGAPLKTVRLAFMYRSSLLLRILLRIQCEN